MFGLGESGSLGFYDLEPVIIGGEEGTGPILKHALRGTSQLQSGHDLPQNVQN